MDSSAGFAASLGGGDSYRLMIEAISDYAIYMLDTQGRVASWNPGARRFKGYTADEILGQHFSRFYTDEDRATGLPARALRTAAAEGRFEHEGWRVRKDGGRFWASVLIDPIRTAEGGLIGYAKITRDLTERRQADETLRRSQEEFRLLVQSVTDYAIYRLDRQGLVSSWNAGAQHIKGYRPEEIIGRHFSCFYPPADAAAGAPETALRIAAAEGRFESEGWRVRKSGERFWAHVVIDAIRDPTGQVIGFAKITRDVTERREAQRALDEAREALFQSQKMDAIGQLTGGVAHDFNNLLMAVLGSLELLRKRMPPDPKLISLVDNATQGAQRGAALTRRMLAFARKQELVLESVSIPDLLHEMLALAQRSLGPGVTVELDLPPDLPPVRSDANQLEAALLNLAINARDSMGDEGVIAISATRQTVTSGSSTGLSAGDYVCLAVRDTGEGMDEATLARATEPFFTTKGVGKGTGLGLPMVHGVTAQSGGRLILKSRMGEGTVAELWLPVAASAAAAKAARPVEAPEHSRPMLILAVDDDDLVLMNTAAMLEDLGHEVLAARSGPEALELVRSARPIDLVITDQAMPGMTGLQLADALETIQPGLPVLLATGYAELPPGSDPEMRRLSKPFRQSELAEAVARMAAPAPRPLRCE